MNDEIYTLVSQLSAVDIGVRVCAAAALGEMGNAAQAAVPALASLVKDPEVNVRRMAVVALGDIAGRADLAVPVLIEAMSDGDVDVPPSCHHGARRDGA